MFPTLLSTGAACHRGWCYFRITVSANIIIARWAVHPAVPIQDCVFLHKERLGYNTLLAYITFMAAGVPSPGK